jgi:hypothetical protein
VTSEAAATSYEISGQVTQNGRTWTRGGVIVQDLVVGPAG